MDDFSRKVWVFLIEHKSEVFKKFKNWKTMIENHTNMKIGTLRTDNDLEFCNHQFNELCEQSGIIRHKTVPYSPQQNGVIERMDRTILEKVRCLLAPTGLSKKFWGEALMTAVNLINKSPNVPLKGKCPDSVFFQKPVSYDNLKVFGCAAYVLTNTDKLEPRTKKCIFLGYPEGTKGYRLWDRSVPGFKLIISRDVVFNEFEFPCKNFESESGMLEIEVEQSENSRNDSEHPVDDNLPEFDSESVTLPAKINLLVHFNDDDLEINRFAPQNNDIELGGAEHINE